MEDNGHSLFSLPPPPPPPCRSRLSLRWLSEVGAALLLAVVVELALPVHHVGGPAVELHLPLALCFVYVV